MTAFSPQVRTLDVASLAGGDMDERDVNALRELLRHLASCSMGQMLLGVAVERRLVIRLVDLDELDWGARGMVGGYYSSAANLIAISKRVGHHQQLSTLAHELQHFVDHALGWDIGNTVQCEVRANQSQALVIQQLRLDAHCYGLANNGALLHPETIAEQIRGSNLYKYNKEEPPRYDGRVHPLLDAERLMPPMQPRAMPIGGGTGPIGAVAMSAPMQSMAASAAASPLFAGGAAMASAAPAFSRAETAWVREPEAPFGVGDRYSNAVLLARR